MSLHEVLAAVCVLVIAALIFFPVIACGCKQVTPTTHCLSNVKRLTTAHLAYAADHGDRLPLSETWMDATESYVRGNSTYRSISAVYQCPEVAKKSPREYGYAFHGKLSRRQLGSLKRPEKAVVLFESIRPERNASDNLRSLPQPGRHSRGRNVFGYADGSAKVR